jgi:aminopeptidase YwaD
MVPEELASRLEANASEQLTALCSVRPDRRPGSAGNHEATAYAADQLAHAGWGVSCPEFACLDWHTEGAELMVGGRSIALTPSPYGRGVSATAPLRVLLDPLDLGRADLAGSIVVLDGPLAAEPLTPKRYPFYSSEEHERVIAALEAAAPAAVLAVTGKYPALCGALDPFPLIEDGDFAVPTANIRPEDAVLLRKLDGAETTVAIRSERRPARARNVIATRGRDAPRVTVIAHIDSKPGTPGAVDNAAGVIVLFMIAEILSPGRCARLPIGVELFLVNGEDHYAAPGEVAWLADNGERLEDIALVVNVDGAGYRGGHSAYSTYNLDAELAGHVDSTFAACPSLVSGPEFYQSDHAIFAMRGRPAAAITTELIEEMLETLFHSAADTPAQVDISLLVDAAAAIANLILTWPPEL